MLVLQRMSKTDMPPGVASWTKGTDAEVVETLRKHYAGEIDITEYWAVGDERKVRLSAMNGIEGTETHDSQTITLVLSAVGGKTLTDGGECAFQVDQKDCLKTSGCIDTDSHSSIFYWRDCDRRSWLNSTYYNAMPETLRSIFKQFKNKSGCYPNSTLTETDDYFAYRASVEIMGSSGTGIEPTAPGEGTQVEWYETSINRIKKGNKVDNYYVPYGTRSFTFNEYVSPIQIVGAEQTGRTYTEEVIIMVETGIAPFGVI